MEEIISNSEENRILSRERDDDEEEILKNLEQSEVGTNLSSWISCFGPSITTCWESPNQTVSLWCPGTDPNFVGWVWVKL